LISPRATPIATKTLPALPQTFFARPAEVVALELIGYLVVTCWEQDFHFGNIKRESHLGIVNNLGEVYWQESGMRMAF